MSCLFATNMILCAVLHAMECSSTCSLYHDKIYITLAYPCIFVYVPVMFSLLRWSPLVGADGGNPGSRPGGSSSAA